MLMVASLGLVVVLIMQAAKPSSWNWLVGPGVDSVGETVDEVPEEIDHQIPRRAANGVTEEGEVRILPSTPYTLGQNSGPRPAESSRKTSKRLASEEALEGVEDNTVFRTSDFEAWNEILASFSEQSNPADAYPITYAQLFQQPSVHRGKMVSVQGTIRRAVPVEGSKLDPRSYYQLWLFPENETRPIVVYCIEPPAEFPTGTKIQQKVQLQGVFFKKWVYAAKGGTMTAPLLICRSFAWTPPVNSGPVATSSGILVGLVTTLCIAAAAIGLIWWNVRNQDSKVEKYMAARKRDAFQRQAEDIEVGESVRDRLGKLADQMKQNDS